MPQGLRYRFWLELIVGVITGIGAVVTLIWHDWIEIVFGADPDKGNGSAEWLVVLILLSLSVAFAVGARLEWRRTRPANS